MRTVLSVLFAAVLVYVAVVGLMFLFQERMLFLPSQHMLATPADRGLDYEDLTIKTADEEELHAWWIPAPEARGTLIFSHGNAGNISGRLESALQFHRLGLNVLLYDYRGYGQSTGSPSEDGVYRDIQAIWEYATEERGVDPASIVLFGRSLGAAPSAWLAEQQPPAVLILESAFTSVPDVAAHHYPFLPVRQLARISMDTESRLPNIAVPLLIIHSRDDEIIPYSHGERLYEVANDPKAFIELRGGHNDGFLRSERRYMEGIDAFLSEHLAPNRTN